MELTSDYRYIGDGVYAANDGWGHILLKSEKNKIYLDEHVRQTLYEILKSEFEKGDNDVS